MSIVDAIGSKRERLFEVMLATRNRSLGTPEAAVRQFLWGFINVLEASARDEHDARELYLQSVIPALKGGPVTLDEVLGGMLRATAAASSVLGPEHVEWLANYCADYTLRLLALWRSSP